MDTRQEKIAQLQSILANPSLITPLTANQKRGFDAARVSRLDTSKELERNLLLQQKETLQENAVQERASEAERRTIEERRSAIETAITTSGNILHSTGDTVAHIPTPGTIATPLIILLVFFLALIPIAGNTRLKWLWLVVTGNADMVAGVASGDITKGASLQQNSTNQPSPPFSIGIIPYMSLEV